MEAKHEEALFNSVKPLCGGYIEATHLLPHMAFLRSKAGRICKAHRQSREEGFNVMYDALLESDIPDKWKIYYEALRESEFNPICKLYEFMVNQTTYFDSFCEIFCIFSTEFTEERLDVITFANALKSTQTITESQLNDIHLCEENDGINSAAILLLAYFPCSWKSLRKGLNECLNSMKREDLLKSINKIVVEDEESSNEISMIEMIKLYYKDIVECVHPLDIWPQLSTDIGWPKNLIEYDDKRKNMEKIMSLFLESTYEGKSQSFYGALSSAGYEQICMKIKLENCHETENLTFKKLIEAKHEYLVKNIEINTILDPLCKAKVINKSDKDEIEALSNQKGHEKAVQCFLERIPLKKDMWYEDFFKILIKNKQSKLVKEIDSDYNINVDTSLYTNVDTNFDTDYVRPKTYELRSYQNELIKNALLGKNCIIASPTGSGKTVVAMEIIKDHFNKNFGKNCKVVFLCNQTALADQQGHFLQDAFPHLKVYIVYGYPESQSKKMELFDLSNIIVMTPQCLVDDLKFKRIENFSIITLLIIDECHHAYGKHPYNVLMSRYVDDKLDQVKYQLPQVIGLTALVGVDVTKSNKNAKEHIIEICANLDCDELCAVKENMEDLDKYVNKPEEYIVKLHREIDCAFSKLIKEFMLALHESLDNTVFHANSICFGTTQYTGWLSEAKAILNSSTLELKHEFATVRFLEVCNTALQLIKGYRVSDALDRLYNYLESETLDTDAFQSLSKLLNFKLEKFEKHCPKEEKEVESTCLVKLVEKIEDKFVKKPDSRVMVFAETRQMVKILQKVLTEKSETQDLNPQYLMADANKDTGGMSINKQKDALGLFRSGECKLLVSTPVGEEGLDIQKCNLVIDYMTVTGVRSHVQKRGRARAADSEYIMIIGSDESLKKRAETNCLKVDLMYKALYEVYDRQVENRIEFKRSLTQTQIENKKLRAITKRKAKPLNDEHTFTLKCTSCHNFAALSSDFRVIEEKCYVVVNPDFRKSIIIYRANQPSDLFDNIKKISKFNCRNCKLKWGIQILYKDTVFDCITISNFKIFNEKNDHIVAKKWLKVPFKDVIKPVSDEDFERVQEADRDFEDVLPANIKKPERNPDEN